MVKSWFMLSERDVDGVVIIGRTVQHTDKHEVEAEGKLQPEELLWFGRCKSSTQRVRNALLVVKGKYTARMGFRSIKPEERIARERHEGIRDVLWEEGFC